MLIDKLKGYSLILASGSPRREELISSLDIPFTIELPTGGEEGEKENSQNSPEELSLKKSLLFGRELKSDEIILTADTLVFSNGEVMGKPKDRAEAVAMLRDLSGGSHKVITGVTLRSVKGRESFSTTTTVHFKELSDREIYYYIEEYAPYDKAGSYGAQEWIGHMAIERFDGCYYNVIGLPISLVATRLALFIDKFH